HRAVGEIRWQRRGQRQQFVGSWNGAQWFGCAARHDKSPRLVDAYGLVRTVTTTDKPERSVGVRAASSSATFTGTRCTTFVKFPVALSGGRSANCDPLAGAISSTRPRITVPG